VLVSSLFASTRSFISFFLSRVLSIDLWKTYLLYVKETKSSLSTYKEKMAQAYDFALDKMGMDIQSSSLWTDYINFLKENLSLVKMLPVHN
jgi:hypothetical protein